MNNSRVVIIEPSPIVRDGLKSMIENIHDFEVVGTLSDINRLDERIAPMRADVVIINPSIVEFHRRNAIKNLFPSTSIIALLYNYIENSVLRQFNGVIDIYDDQAKIHNTLQEAITNFTVDDTNTDGNDLSEREKEILVAVAKGLMNKEIAALYKISIHTVISHRKNISRKTGIKSVSGFVVYALLNNLIEQNDIHY